MGILQTVTSVTVLQEQLAGLSRISFTNWDTSAESAIAAGSGIEIGNTWFECTSNTSINASSWTAIATSSNCFVYLQVSGTAGSQILTPYYTTNVPVWRTDAQGWYWSASSSLRYVMSLYKGSSTQYNYKRHIKNVQNTGYVISEENSPESNNIFSGYQAGYSNSTGTSNTFIGYQAGYNNTSGTSNLFSGYQVGYTNIGGNYNVFSGYQVGYSFFTGLFNVFSGYQAGYNAAAGNYNTFIGSLAGYDNYANGNTFIGSLAGRNNTSGTSNLFSGYEAGYTNTVGTYNTFVGYQAGRSTNSGDSNCFFGYKSGYTNSNHNNNTFMGYESGNGNTGINNSFFGYQAGNLLYSGTSNTCIGKGSNAASTTASNTITLGDSNITTLRCNASTITALSDARDKRNIEDIKLGLNFINELRSVEFNWDMREWYPNYVSDGSKTKEEKSIGFIAQEVAQVQDKLNANYLNLVYKDNPNRLELDKGTKLIPILVKAIQELSQENTLLKERLSKIEEFLKIK